MPIKKYVKAIDAALRDADRARKHGMSAEFRKDVQADRRGTLRKFETVEHALQDREKIEKSKAKAKKK
jgi:hypothetical protein